MSTNIKVIRICECCKTEFTAKTTVTKYCSHRCASRAYKAKVKAINIERSNQETIERKELRVKDLLDKEFLKVKEVAEILEVSKDAVYDMINSGDGELKTCRLSERRTRIRVSDFMSFIENRSQKLTAKAKAEKREEIEVNPNSGLYSYGDVMDMFDKSRDATYSYLNRAKVSKIKKGKEVFFPKNEVEKLFRQFKKTKYLGHEKERASNEKLAKKGIRRSECYTMEQCIDISGLKRENLYGIFSRRKVPKIRDGKIVYYSKKAVDRIFKSLKKGGTEL